MVSIHIHLKSFLRYSYVLWINYGSCPRHSVLMWERVWESVVIFRSQKSSASKNVWETRVYEIMNHFLQVVHEITSVCLHVMRAGVWFYFRELSLYFVEECLLPLKHPNSWLRKGIADYVFTKHKSIEAVEHSLLLTLCARNLKPNSPMTFKFPFPFLLQIKWNFLNFSYQHLQTENKISLLISTLF
jgi:hypothetical protein